jgi:hypothetical protein
MSCQCRESPSAVRVSDPKQAPLDRAQLVERSVPQWAALYRCEACGQLWRLDLGVEVDRCIPVAIKRASQLDWAVDDMSERRDLYIREHGGLSDEPCAWAGCRERAVRGMKICAQHANISS